VSSILPTVFGAGGLLAGFGSLTVLGRIRAQNAADKAQAAATVTTAQEARDKGAFDRLVEIADRYEKDRNDLQGRLTDAETRLTETEQRLSSSAHAEATCQQDLAALRADYEALKRRMRRVEQDRRSPAERRAK